MDFKKLKLTQLESNKGQIEGVPANPRQIRAERLELLSQNLTELPDLIQARPLIVSPLGDRFIIICGNMRFEAAKKLKYKEIDCAVLPADTDAKALRHIATVDNVGFGEWEWDILANEWNEAELKEWGVELPNLQSEVLEAEDDNYEEPENLQVDVGLGDLIEIGEHRLLCGDSTDIAQVERLMGGEKADLFITDPPYGVSYAEKNRFLNAIAKGNRIQEPIHNDHKSLDELKEFWRLVAYNAYVVCSNKASYYWFMCQGGDQMMMMMMMIGDAGWKVRHELIWVKNNHVLGRADYAYKHEPIAFGWKKDGTHEFYGGFQTSVFEVDKPLKNDVHPTMKPVELIAKLIANSSKEGQNILDLFLGSGTTMVAAHQLKRRCFGMELDPKYCQVIIDRMQKLDPNLEVKINGKPYKKAVSF